MKALTIWQPWATLVAAGVKPYEFRHWPAPARLVGQRIVIHAGSRPVRLDEINGLRLQFEKGGSAAAGYSAPGRALDILERWWRSREGLILGAVLCTAVLGTPRKALDIFTGQMDPGEIDPDIWGWPLSEIQPMEPPVPARGAQGFWTWKGYRP